jgi:hypothetical protein
MNRFGPGEPADVEINQLTNLLEDLQQRTEALRRYL